MKTSDFTPEEQRVILRALEYSAREYARKRNTEREEQTREVGRKVRERFLHEVDEDSQDALLREELRSFSQRVRNDLDELLEFTYVR